MLLIEKLSEQAGEWVEEQMRLDSLKEFRDRWGVSSRKKLFDKRFSELIVEECVFNIAKDTSNYPGEFMMAYYQGVQDAIKAINNISKLTK